MSDDPVEAAIAARMAKAKPNGAGQTPLPPLRIIDPGVYQGKPVPERRWIVPDWIPVGYVTGLYGPGGYGKTLIAQQLQTALALGEPWLGIPIHESVRSLAIYCEDDEDELQRRQAAINMQLYGCDFSGLSSHVRWMSRLGMENYLMVFTKKGIPELTPFYDQVIEAARDFEAQFVITDTVADTFSGNQNDMGQVRTFVQFCLGGMARAIGGAVMANAHPSVAGLNSGTSGSVQWDAAFRSRLYLRAPKKDNDDDDQSDPDARVLTRMKANYAARDASIDLRSHNGVMRTEEELATGDRPPAEVVFLDLLDKMTQEGQTLSHKKHSGSYAPRLFTRRASRYGYRVNDFEQAMQRLLETGAIKVVPHGKPSSGAAKIAHVVADVESPF
jgi:RecA-family ATPase